SSEALRLTSRPSRKGIDMSLQIACSQCQHKNRLPDDAVERQLKFKCKKCGNAMTLGAAKGKKSRRQEDDEEERSSGSMLPWILGGGGVAALLIVVVVLFLVF